MSKGIPNAKNKKQETKNKKQETRNKKQEISNAERRMRRVFGAARAGIRTPNTVSEFGVLPNLQCG
jgi:hypothetical protein